MRSRYKLLFLVSILLIIFQNIHTNVEEKAFFQGLGTVFGIESVSADGTVVGTRYKTHRFIQLLGQLRGNLKEDGTRAEAFVWNREDGMSDLGELPGGDLFSKATGVSADGTVVVGNSVSTNGREAFIWNQKDGMSGLGDLPGGIFHSTATGVSADGTVVVGNSVSANGSEAFVWNREDGMRSLSDLPGGGLLIAATGVSADGTMVIGSSKSTNGREAFIWNRKDGMRSLGDLPDGIFHSTATRVSADGNAFIVGNSVSANGREAFVWNQKGGMRSLGNLLPSSDFSSIATGVSANGTVVVGYIVSRVTLLGTEAFIWDKQKEMRSLKEVLENEYNLDLTGWTLTKAENISADGSTIIGYGTNPDGTREAWISKLHLES